MKVTINDHTAFPEQIQYRGRDALYLSMRQVRRLGGRAALLAARPVPSFSGWAIVKNSTLTGAVAVSNRVRKWSYSNVTIGGAT